MKRGERDEKKKETLLTKSAPVDSKYPRRKGDIITFSDYRLHPYMAVKREIQADKKRVGGGEKKEERKRTGPSSDSVVARKQGNVQIR